jgi:hypothetical protein
MGSVPYSKFSLPLFTTTNISILQVQMSSPTQAQVTQSDGIIYLVDLAIEYCGCGRFQQNRMPCGHAMSLIFALQHRVEAYMPAELLTERWMATYLAPIPPVDLSGLKPRHIDDEEDGAGNVCNPPHTRLPRGRPRKVRMDKGQYRASRGATQADLDRIGQGEMAVRRQQVHCSTCREPGHYSRSCRRAHN